VFLFCVSAGDAVGRNEHGFVCSAGDGLVVAADSQAEIYIAHEPYYEEGTHARLGTLASYRGCVYGRARSFLLGMVGVGSSRGGVSTGNITLHGTVVAYAKYRAVIEIAEVVQLTVQDLRTGRVIRSVPDGVPLKVTSDYFSIGVGQISSIVLKTDGSVAWIARDVLRSEKAEHETGKEVNYYDLYALDRHGERLIAAGTDVAPNSLALAGTVVYWTEGGTPHSAPLG